MTVFFRNMPIPLLNRVVRVTAAWTPLKWKWQRRAFTRLDLPPVYGHTGREIAPGLTSYNLLTPLGHFNVVSFDDLD